MSETNNIVNILILLAISDHELHEKERDFINDLIVEKGFEANIDDELEKMRNRFRDDFDTSCVYYLNSINIWNHPNNNGIPSEFEAPNTEVNDTQNKSILEVLLGSKQRSTDETTTLNFNGDSGGQFDETKVNPVLSFAGDNIFEGREGAHDPIASDIKKPARN